MNAESLEQLVLQCIEQASVGVRLYRMALTCVVDADLNEEWSKHLRETSEQVSILEEVCAALGFEPTKDTPDRRAVRHWGDALCDGFAICRGLRAEDMERWACERIVLLETKSHLDWELLGKVACELKGPAAEILERAHDQVHEQADEHSHHARAWCRELWLKSLGMKALFPPPEERRSLTTVIRQRPQASRTRKGTS
jgi:hypothetical protein